MLRNKTPAVVSSSPFKFPVSPTRWKSCEGLVKGSGSQTGGQLENIVYLQKGGPVEKVWEPLV